MRNGVRFGTYEFDPERRELRKHGLHVKVPAQSLEILAALLERPGETVTRERVRRLLWPHGTVVGFEQSINTAVKRLREALSDPADNPRFIERVPRTGYRFIAPTQPLPGLPEDGLNPGKLIQHYRLLERVGAGCRGEVWKAEDTKLGRTVALKFLSLRLEADEDALEAFRQEARHVAASCHPNICTIYSLEEHRGLRFIAMEYIDGNPLTTLLNGTPLPAHHVLAIGVQATLALAAAHSKGVIHRDVKPANLMLTADLRVKLADFGIAIAVRSQRLPPCAGGGQTPAGTLGYLSPEQARGEPVDARSDLFSLGSVLYEMATGIRPSVERRPRRCWSLYCTWNRYRRVKSILGFRAASSTPYSTRYRRTPVRDGRARMTWRRHFKLLFLPEHQRSADAA
jgi:serine/threonine protein kinase